MRAPWHIPFVLALTTFIHYLDRNALALALPRIAEERGWDDAAIGLYGEYLLGAFYLSFGLFQIALSGPVERWNVKGGLLLSITGFSVATMLFYPLGGTVGALIVLRLLLGAGESLHMPMNSAIIARTFPPDRHARANSIYVGGILLALMLGPLLLIPLMDWIGWRASFAALGAGGLLLALPLVIIAIPPLPANHRIHVPAVRLHPAFWMYVAAGAANAFCIFGMLNWLPSYLTRARGMPFSALSLPLFGIFSAGIIGIAVWAWLGDRTRRRLLLATIGLFFAGVAVLLTALPVENETILILLMAGIFFQSSYNAQEFATLQAMYPPSCVGTVTGIYNGLTVLIGGVGGSFIPGTIVAWTGDLGAGILSIAGGAFLVAGLLGWIQRTISL